MSQKEEKKKKKERMAGSSRMADAEYHSKDFEWREVEEEVENDPSLQYHLIPFTSPSPSPSFSSEPWRSFHRRHSAGKFFKERRYLLKEFPEMATCDDSAKVLEVGCGNGSTVLPILRARQSIVVYACDCSEEVLARAKEMIDATSLASIKNRFRPFLLDFSVNVFPEWLLCTSCRKNILREPVNFPSDANSQYQMSLEESSFLRSGQCCVGGVDFVTLIFTLSAVPFEKMPFVIGECISILKPGCLLLFRDYGLYDMTMLRFSLEQRLGFREYTRSDGTLSYFFSLDIVRDLFLRAGFVELELEYCCVRSVNRRSGKKMQRVWVHGKFQKPALSHT